MQHTPHLAETLDGVIKGRLKDTSYPFVDGQPGVGPNSTLQRFVNRRLDMRSLIRIRMLGRKISSCSWLAERLMKKQG